ncbi:MAG: PHB depolymerase family esterase [Candidatus Melainabacteria bacterium]|nr:PHB depolymerase family esterase [Candidatus Melainabacteria bacterium]
MDNPAPTDATRQPTALIPVIDGINASFSDQALSEISKDFGDFKTVTRDGSRIVINRDKTDSIKVGSEFLNGNLTVDTLDFSKDVGLEIDRNTKTASNITGVALNLTIFGSPYTMDVTKVRLGTDAKGQKTLFTELKNPMPEPARRVAGMPPSFSVEIPVTADGFKAPVLSKVFADAASSTGPSIAGLLTSDGLTEASKVALFIESNPKWVNHVVEPALQDIFKALVLRSPDPTQKWLPVEAPTPFNANKNPSVGFVEASLGLLQKPKDITAPLMVPDISKPGDYDQTMIVEGAERKYHIHVPPSYNGKTPMPMVMLLHGHGQDGKIIAEHTKFDQMADREGFIAIYPDARSWAGRDEWRAWDTDNGLIPPGSNADDVSFLRKMIDKAESTYAIDPKRIYLAGLSNGGMMSFRAAGDLSDKIAAIAVISGAMSGNEPPPKSPISVLNIHGTDDGIVPYDGLKNVPASLAAIGLPKFKSMDYATNFWVEQNKITNPPIVINNNRVTERKFINQESGAEVNETTIRGDRHVPADIDAVTNQIWKFFVSHPKATGQTSGTVQLSDGEAFNITKKLQGHMAARGVNGLQLDAAQMLAEVKYLRDGSVSPAGTLGQFEKQSGVHLSDTVSMFLKSTQSVSKNGERIQIDMASPQKIDINSGGPVNVKALNVESTSFNLYADKNRSSLTDIRGISFEVEALGRPMNVPVTEVNQKVDSNGAPYYRVKAQNPIGSWSRAVMFADQSIPIEMRIGDNGNPSILNHREIKDATLGVNPVIRGYLDIGTHGQRAFANPSVGSGLNLAKDVGIMGGSGFGAYKLAAMKFGTKGKVGVALTVGLVVAPAAIHGIERLLGDDAK